MAALGAGAALSFRRTLARHLEAIHESAGTGIAVLRLLYEEPGVRQESLLTLVFEKRGDKWLVVLDQNTPSK